MHFAMAPFVLTAILLLVSTSYISISLAEASGFSFASCRTDSDCYGSRECRDMLTSRSREDCDLDGTYCVCFPKNIASVFCGQQSGCDNGEMCLQIPEQFTDFEARACLDRSQVIFYFFRVGCQVNSDCLFNGTCVTFNDSTALCAAPKP